jgi:hypothetical protein
MGVLPLPDLANSIMHLVNEGVYSLYRLKQVKESAEYLLLTSEGKYYLLSSTGKILSEIADFSVSEIAEPIRFQPLKNDLPTITLNYL